MVRRNIFRTLFGLAGSVLMTALTLALVLSAGSAYADTPADEAPRELVPYGDLNLESEAGVRRLYRRIQAAAHQVCQGHDGRNLWARRAYRTCLSQAVSSAVSRLNHPRLSALHSATMPGWRGENERKPRPQA